MIIGLVVVLGFILFLPFLFRFVEHNLEYFLFFMGIAAAIISGTMSSELILHILENHLLYIITAAVLIAGLLFRLSVDKIRIGVETVTKRIPLKVFIFIIIVFLGLISSVITAIVASLILVEIIHALPLNKKNKTAFAIIACFSIGLGAALTPIGEPLSTIVVSVMKVDFFYLLREIGIFIIPGIIIVGIFGAFYIDYMDKKCRLGETAEVAASGESNCIEQVEEKEELKVIFIRAFKIFIFVIALELLGAGFKPLINNYIIHLDGRILYWINMTSSVLDNATIAAAELSPAMNLQQIKAILMGLLISGGMMIPGNIPNIISAGKLKIKSRDWAAMGVPMGVLMLLAYYGIIFMF
ncbi:putative cation transporter [Anaerobacterium chartisolvens]|uniref:Putative cation transporter n=1 Tax=Anaerobacterium chartisolvens TaxID=1297424 RepID=A0A369BGX5_9FIRM|nr:DUF1646 family protein [Anaerobacterium chartisolvens]RCX18934.1 putative cation transporter [Anaerobacterium chartisolvens]